MGKKAVLIGCNYAGTKAQLKGCVNDVKKMHRCLIDRYGFLENDIKVLIDADDSYTQPTGRNIRSALSDLIKSAESGDFLFVHYSGHGTRLPAETGEDDDTGYDECIVPCDMNLITDDDFRELVDKVPQGCRITIVSDSCHSGGLIDDCKEQIGESFKDESEVQGDGSSASGIRGFLQKTGDAIESAFHRDNDGDDVENVTVDNRSLPLDIIVDILKQKTGKDDINVGNVRPSLFDVFGEDSTPKVKKFMKVLFNSLKVGDGGDTDGGGGGGGGGFLGKVSELAQSLLKPKLENNADYGKSAMEAEVEGKQDAYAGSKKKKLPENGILISGCQTDQTSADATPSKTDQAESYGALSHAIQKIVDESEGKISNREVVMKARDLMQKHGFKQRPGLYCEDKHVDAPFICE